MEVLGWLVYPLVVGVFLVHLYFSALYFCPAVGGDGVVLGPEVVHDPIFSNFMG